MFITNCFEEFEDTKGIIRMNPYIEEQSTQWPTEKRQMY